MHEEDANLTMINPHSLKMLREARKLTQEKLAEKAGLSKRVVAACEDPNRDSKPRATTATKLANALGVSVSALSDPVDSQPREERLEPTTVRMSENTKANFTALKKLYGVTRDEVVEFSPIMFAILAEMSLERRRRQYPKWVRSLDLNDEQSAYYAETAWLKISSREIFDNVPNDDGDENPFGEFIQWLSRKWKLDGVIDWMERQEIHDYFLARSFDQAYRYSVTDHNNRMPNGTLKASFRDWREDPPVEVPTMPRGGVAENSDVPPDSETS